MLLCLAFTDGPLKGQFGKVFLASPPLSVVMTVLCLQHDKESLTFGKYKDVR